MPTKKKTKYKPEIVGADPEYLHKPAQCKGQPCCLHNPSKHHMVDWKLNLRSSGLMERICPHGIGHPDPDSVAYFRRVDPAHEWLSVHGCDECCIDPKKRQKAVDDRAKRTIPVVKIKTRKPMRQQVVEMSMVYLFEGLTRCVLVTGRGDCIARSDGSGCKRCRLLLLLKEAM